MGMGCKVIKSMQRSFFRTGILSLAVAFAVGCGSNNSGDAPKESGAGTEKAATTLSVPMWTAKDLQSQTSLEVQSFKGGYDIDFFQKCANDYMKANPGVKIKLEGNPRVWEQLQPRMVSGDPPDLMFPGWGMDHWALAEEGQIFDLTEALKSPSADGKTPWGETFEPALLKLGQLEGVQVTLPYYMMIYGWWYDPAVFKANGWTAPKTWKEFMELAPKIKAKGMAPLTFQGKYPYYLVYGMLLPWVQSIGGIEAVNACQNMEPGAWKSESVLKAAQMLEEIRDKGFFQEGAISMTHTESQQEFLNGKAAMVPCGTWLKSEMRNMMKPGAKLAFMLPPSVEGGKGDPGAINVDIEPWMFPSKAKASDRAIDFFKYMTSLDNAKAFVKEKGTLMAIKGSNEGELPEELVLPAKAFKESKTVWSIKFRHWYKGFMKELEDSLTALLSKTLTSQQFVERLEKAAQAVREDESITKHKV